MMKEEKTCSGCGAAYPAEQLTQFGDSLLCRSCLNMETVVWSHCGVRVWNDNDYGDSSIPLCERCYNEYYTTCSRCERVIHRDDAYYDDDDDEPYCSDCYNRCSSNSVIHDYYYKPIPKFYGYNGRYFGVELEVDDAGEDDGCDESVINITNASDEHIYCKHDGSLDNGFEIVTHPMTLDYQLNKMPWLDVVTKLREMGYE